jgi:hypothetical protein
MYFGQGTATNSGVVGIDNQGWVKRYPFFHDYPGQPIVLTGQNFNTENFLSQAPADRAYTGAYSPFGVPTASCEIRMTPTSISGSSPIASGGVESPSEGSMFSFSLPSSLSVFLLSQFFQGIQQSTGCRTRGIIRRRTVCRWVCRLRNELLRSLG